MSKTILLADDSVTIQKVVGISFANEDVVLLTVDNGDDAVSRAREVRPDLVLADVAMPGLDGYAVCEAIKSDSALRHVPVLLLSGTFERFDEERARQVGADGHVSKPFEAQALVDRVNDLLARSEASRPVSGAETTVLVSEPPSAADAFEFFDDELAAPEPAGSAATVLLDQEDEEPIPLQPIAADPLELESTMDADLEPVVVARFVDDPLRADGATVVFDDGPPPLPSQDVEFGITRSRFSLPAAERSSDATRLLELDEAAAHELRPEATTSFRETAAPATAPDHESEADLFADEPAAPVRPSAPASADAVAAASPGLEALRGELRGHLEKVAWEAFGDLSERIVRETVARVEAIAWEVIPQLAETLIREEIRKLQSEE